MAIVNFILVLSSSPNYVAFLVVVFHIWTHFKLYYSFSNDSICLSLYFRCFRCTLVTQFIMIHCCSSSEISTISSILPVLVWVMFSWYVKPIEVVISSPMGTILFLYCSLWLFSFMFNYCLLALYLDLSSSLLIVVLLAVFVLWCDLKLLLLSSFLIVSSLFNDPSYGLLIILSSVYCTCSVSYNLFYLKPFSRLLLSASLRLLKVYSHLMPSLHITSTWRNAFYSASPARSYLSFFFLCSPQFLLSNCTF